jgi:hypothetical protein
MMASVNRSVEGPCHCHDERDHLFWYEQAMVRLLRKGLIHRYLWSQNVNKVGERPMQFCLSVTTNAALAILGFFGVFLVYAMSRTGLLEAVICSVFLGLAVWGLAMAIHRWEQCAHRMRQVRQTESEPPEL